MCSNDYARSVPGTGGTARVPVDHTGEATSHPPVGVPPTRAAAFATILASERPFDRADESRAVHRFDQEVVYAVTTMIRA